MRPTLLGCATHYCKSWSIIFVMILANYIELYFNNLAACFDNYWNTDNSSLSYKTIDIIMQLFSAAGYISKISPNGEHIHQLMFLNKDMRLVNLQHFNKLIV